MPRGLYHYAVLFSMPAIRRLALVSLYQRCRILLGHHAPSASRISHDGSSTPSSTPFLWSLSWKLHGSYRLHMLLSDMQVLQD